MRRKLLSVQYNNAFSSERATVALFQIVLFIKLLILTKDFVMRHPEAKARRVSLFMNPIYRTFKESEIKSLIKLMAQLGYEHSKESLLNNVNSVRRAGGEVFVAEVSGSVCGCISAIIDVRLAEGVKGEIVSLVVNESARGKGIGKGLVVTAEKWLSHSTSEIRVRANAIREQAHFFYKNMGYSLNKQQVILIKNV